MQFFLCGKVNLTFWFLQSHYKKPVYLIRREILSNTSQCVGADSLLKLLSNYCRNKDLQTSITVGVVGK